jgi:hypothetical protein
MTDILTKDIFQLIFSIIDDSKTWIALSKINKLANKVSKEMLLLTYDEDKDKQHWVTLKLPSREKYGLEVLMMRDSGYFVVKYNLRINMRGHYKVKYSWRSTTKNIIKYEWSKTTFSLTWKRDDIETVSHYDLWGTSPDRLLPEPTYE